MPEIEKYGELLPEELLIEDYEQLAFYLKGTRNWLIPISEAGEVLVPE